MITKNVDPLFTRFECSLVLTASLIAENNNFSFQNSSLKTSEPEYLKLLRNIQAKSEIVLKDIQSLSNKQVDVEKNPPIG